MTCYPEKKDKRLTGIWIAEAYLAPIMGTRTRVRERFTSKAEGDRWAALVEATGQRVCPTRPNEPKAGPTWLEVSDACKAAGGAKRKWKSGRDPNVVQRLDLVARILGPDTPIAAVNAVKLDYLVAQLAKIPARGRGPTLAPASINRYLSFTSSVLKFAKSRGYIAECPEVPWQTTDSKRLLWLTEADEEAICNALLSRGWNVADLTVRVLTATGMRWGEFASLEPGQIADDPSGPSWVTLWRTKTNRPRSIPIAQPLARELRGMIAAGQGLSHTTMRDQFRWAVKAAGRDPGLCIHSLRHTTASRLAIDGHQAQKIQKMLGHSSIATTMKYVHLRDEDLSGMVKNATPKAGLEAPKEAPEVISFPMISKT